MSEASESARKIRQRIEEAFGHRKRLPVVLRKDTAIWDDQERLTVGSMFESGRRRWQDIDCEEIDPYIEEIMFEYLTPEALRYYLPAFMICCLDFRIMNSNMFALGIKRLLSPPRGRKESDLVSFEEWARHFTQGECATITAFLEYLLLDQIIPYEDTYSPSSDFVMIDRAYQYWSQRC